MLLEGGVVVVVIVVVAANVMGECPGGVGVDFNEFVILALLPLFSCSIIAASKASI